MKLEELNALPGDEASDLFGSCCASSRWVDAMSAARPFESIDEMFDAADRAWADTDASDWHEAFAHHPRIGARATGWAASEQAGMQRARATVQDELAEMNDAYEQRFGHIYIVCAAGKTAEEMLASARSRMQNDTFTELRIAAAEQHKITRLRLRKLLGETT